MDDSDLTEEEREALDAGASEDELASRRAERGSDPTNPKSIEEQAESEPPEPPPPPPLEGESQLSLVGMAPRGTPIESEISIMSKAHPIKGLLKPESEIVLVITARVQKYEYVPVRENGAVVRYKHRQQLRILSVAEASTEAGRVAAAGE